MGNNMSIKEILESYDEISVIKEISDRVYLFALFGKEYLFFAPLDDEPSSYPSIHLYNDDGTDFPHIMLKEETIPEGNLLPEGKYRYVCLYEHESVVNTIIPYEEKISDALDRLIELLSMNGYEREREFQKEFMYYWNSNALCTNTYRVYLSQEQSFAEMETYFNGSNVRVIEKGLHLSDIDSREKDKRKWDRHIENDTFYVPIIDNREIIPPHSGYNWTSRDVKNIIYPLKIEHLSDYTYQQIKCTIPSTQNVILLFGMKTELSSFVFAVRIKCRNGKGHSLLQKVLEDIVDVEVLYTQREDYLYLNEQIGNDIGILRNKILVVGAGSLGSYISFELVKSGASNLKIYDGDALNKNNVFRWAYGGIGLNTNKAEIISLLLNLLHPEVNVEAIAKNLDVQDLLETMPKVDIAIFTIGSSDEQLKFNRALRNSHCMIPVLYVWLEAGGIYSHILYVNYQKAGCFECLYTDEKGNLTNNRAQRNSDEISQSSMIRNGCGGTRAAYGTAILLRTTAALLDIIQKIQTGAITDSVLIDVSPDAVRVSCTKFPSEECNCCGNKQG